ncbi:Six-hairpin glycosidase-like protein [Lentinula raphanica]|nr:Six-hairpin glycosidase-like protein [Lentinula raphanica]
MLRNTDIAGLLTRYKNGLLKLPYDLNAFPYPPPVCNLIESVLSPMKFAIQKASTVLAGILLSSSLSVGVRSQCPDFTTYSASPQGNPSNGTLGLPLMRPAPACRTFNSTAVEQVIDDMKARLKDPDVARLFENTFPNTLDTTVRYYNQTENLAFIITGDITAQWLRDTANQFAHYRSLLSIDPDLATLVKAVINNEARYITQYPYCGAFQPPPESGLAPSSNGYAVDVIVNPPVDNQTVFECKYEIDSLCGFLKLSTSYYNETRDASILNDNWFSAINQIFQVINNQSQGSWDEDFNFISFYNWTGSAGSLSPAVNNGGNGEPKAFTGMVGTHHRPSDDLSTFAFLTPANAMLSVELTNLALMLDEAGQGANISQSAKEWSSRINESIWANTLVDDVFAYETNGYGGRYVMDDANVPSLLSLPYLGFLERDNPSYVATRKILLSRKNPYFAAGQNFSGIGGPHIDAWNPWPMSQISAIFGTDDDEEIMQSLYLIVNNTDGLGLIHESVSIYNQSDFTRTWFAWANSYFAEMLLDLAERKPGLIFDEAVSYVPGK